MDSELIYNIDSVPITLTNEKNLGRIRVFGTVVIAIGILCSVTTATLDVLVWHKGAIFPEILTTILMGIGGFVIFYKPLFQRTSIKIDEAGVHISKDGHQREYLWVDIFDAKVTTVPHFDVNTGRTTYTDYLEIGRKGDLIYNERSYCPREDFGVGANHLASIIGDGVVRWGTADVAT